MGNNILQGSQEWLSLRRKMIGASDAAVILGISPWKSPYQLFEEKMGIGTQEETPAMRRGTELEPIARAEFEKVTGISVTPKVLFHPVISYMMASMDGVSEDGKQAVEIKCPGESTYKAAMAGQIPDHYMAQLQHQMAVASLKSIFYFCFDGSEGILLEIERNQDYIIKIYEKEAEFWDRLQNFDPPPMNDKDVVPIDSLEWRQTAFEYQQMKQLREKYEKEENALRERLIDQAGQKSVRGGGIQVTKVIRRGNIEYAKIPELNGLDLEPYRKSPVESWRITCQTS